MSFPGFVSAVSTASIPQIGENVVLGEKFEQAMSQGEGGCCYKKAMTGTGVTIVVALHVTLSDQSQVCIKYLITASQVSHCTTKGTKSP